MPGYKYEGVTGQSSGNKMVPVKGCDIKHNVQQGLHGKHKNTIRHAEKVLSSYEPRSVSANVTHGGGWIKHGGVSQLPWQEHCQN